MAADEPLVHSEMESAGVLGSISSLMLRPTLVCQLNLGPFFQVIVWPLIHPFNKRTLLYYSITLLDYFLTEFSYNTLNISLDSQGHTPYQQMRGTSREFGGSLAM